MQETEPTSTRSGLRFGKFCSTKLLCVFLTVVLDAAAIPVNDGSSNVMPDVTAIDPMPEPKNSGLLFASPDRHPTFAPRPTPPVPNLKENAPTVNGALRALGHYLGAPLPGASHQAGGHADGRAARAAAGVWVRAGVYHPLSVGRTL